MKVQWSNEVGSNQFHPISRSVSTLPVGKYEVLLGPDKRSFFSKTTLKEEPLFKFEQYKYIFSAVKSFWDNEPLFKKANLSHKLGILLHGPRGCGKTSLMKMLYDEIFVRNGIVIKFDSPYNFIDAFAEFRQIQPDTPVIVDMEDLDAILDIYGEADVLNILDGSSNYNKVLFVATTNYPEKLSRRISDRPGRFDLICQVNTPDKASRRIYLEFLLNNNFKCDIDTWIKDTSKFSFAHLKELFISVLIRGEDYKPKVTQLKEMIEKTLSSVDYDGDSKIGFTIPQAKVI